MGESMDRRTVEKILTGLGVSSLSKVRDWANDEGIPLVVALSYIFNRDNALIGVHPHEMHGAAKRLTANGDGALTTLTVAPAAGRILMVESIFFLADAGGNTINSLRIDGNEVDIYDINNLTVAANNAQLIWGARDGAARGVVLNTTQYPWFNQLAACRIGVTVGFTAAPLAAARVRVFGHERTMSPQEEEANF